ncbi:response regulator [Thermodesulfobacteriota bacterium]
MREYTILISDRNRNVREFLRREMESEGYTVLLARSAREVLNLIYNHEFIDLVILDPELPDAEQVSVLEKITDRIPSLPLIVHAFSPDYTKRPAVLSIANFVEKKGSSIEYLKKVVSELLSKSNP